MKKLLSALLCVIMVMSGVVLTYAGSYYGKDVNVIEKFSFDCDPSFEGNVYSLGVISADSSQVTFGIEYNSSTLIHIYDTNIITAKLNGNTADFNWSDNWDNSGYGSVTFNSNSVVVKMVLTKTNAVNNNRLTLDTRYLGGESGTLTLYSESNSAVTYNKIMNTQANAVKTPFYGVWVSAYKNVYDAQNAADKLTQCGYKGCVFVTTDWSNLNSEKWYVVSAGAFATKSQADSALSVIKWRYPGAYVKYSGYYKG